MTYPLLKSALPKYTMPILAKSGLLISALTVLMLSACASTPERGGPPPDRQARGSAKTAGTFAPPVALLFSDMDTNRDAVITRAELDAGINSEWASFGRDPSATYFMEWSVRKLGSTDAKPTFMSFDADFNRVVSQDEFSSRLEAEFTRMDKNQDGRLMRMEMLVAFAGPQDRGVRQSKGGEGERQGKGGGGGRPPR